MEQANKCSYSVDFKTFAVTTKNIRIITYGNLQEFLLHTTSFFHVEVSAAKKTA